LVGSLIALTRSDLEAHPADRKVICLYFHCLIRGKSVIPMTSGTRWLLSPLTGRVHLTVSWPLFLLKGRFSTRRVSAALQKSGGVIVYGYSTGTYMAIPISGAWWMKNTTHIVKNALLGTPDPNVSVMRKCDVFPVEFVCRGFMTGLFYKNLFFCLHMV